MRRAMLLIASPLALLACTIFVFDAEREARAQMTTTIQVGDLWFCGPSLPNGVCDTTIRVGDTVVWQWVGVSFHTTTECGGNLDVCPEPHLWDSPAQKTGTFAFTFNSPGAYVYRCQVHATVMRGRITVLAATPQPTATPSPTPLASASPSPSPGAPAPTPGALPAGGGAPPSQPPGQGPLAAAAWWLALAAGGGILLIAAAGLVVRTLRR